MPDVVVDFLRPVRALLFPCPVFFAPFCTDCEQSLGIISAFPELSPTPDDEEGSPGDHVDGAPPVDPGVPDNGGLRSSGREGYTRPVTDFRVLGGFRASARSEVLSVPGSACLGALDGSGGRSDVTSFRFGGMTFGGSDSDVIGRIVVVCEERPSTDSSYTRDDS